MAQAPETIPPQYVWLKKADLPSLTVDQLNTQDITIAIATDQEGNVYTLSFGAGVDKWNAEGVKIVNDLIPAGLLDSPLDIAVDEGGFIYIADYLAAGESFEDNGKIRVFDSLGNYLPERTILTSFYRPLGIDVDSDNVFVAEYNDGNSGPETTPMSRIRIYNKLNGIAVDETSQVEVPYRIAVNSQGRVYVSQAGNDDPAVLVFDSSLNLQGELSNITSPGSVVVDPFDFVHVIEYNNRIDFAEFINFEDLGFGDILDISGQIYRGQRNEEFVIKVFDPSHTLVRSVIQNIDFPLDMAFNSCDRMYVNNAEIIGNDIPFVGFLPSKMEFDLEIYKRTPSFDIEDPVITCLGNFEVSLPPGQSQITLSFSSARVSDNCSATVIQTKGPKTGTQVTAGTYEIEFTATDEAENSSVCSFIITVGDEEAEASMENCPSNITTITDPNDCEARVNYNAPTATQGDVDLEVTRTAGPAPGSLFPVGSTTVTFQATASNGEVLSCSFQVIVTDNQAPEIGCLADMEVTTFPGEDSAVVNFETPDATDNCSVTVTQTSGSISGSEFPLGTHIIEFTATDPSGKTDTCSFEILVKEPEPPTFKCPAEADLPVLELDQNCGLTVPDYSYLLGEFQNFQNEQIFEQSEVRAGNLLEVTIEVYDGEAFVNSCEFKIPLVDRIKPTINCPSSPQTISKNGEGKYILPDYRGSVSDNCDENPEVVQVPAPGEITEGTTVTLVATDEAGNSSVECSFTVVLVQDGEPSFNCPTGSEIPEITLDENCDYDLPNLNDLVSNFQNFQNSPLITTRTEQIDDFLQIQIRVYDGFEEEELLVGECNFTIELIDATPPVARCVSGLTVQLGQDGTVSIEPEDLDNGSSDSCGEVSLSLSQSTFTAADIPKSPVIVSLTATDESGNSIFCLTQVTVEPYNPEEPQDFSCISSLSLDLNERGEAILDVDQLFEGSLGPDASFSVDKEVFTCADIGQQTVTLTYSGTSSGSCPITITVTDNTPPEARSKDIEVSLDENGTASITAAQMNNGSSDNCGISDLEFQISESTFTCNDIGENVVDFEVTDGSGNSSATKVTVTVIDPQGVCEIDPVEPPTEGRFVMIYPNPSRGEVQIATSPGIVLQRVEIFDMRGRFLDSRELILNILTQSYQLDLKSYQTGVYTLKLYSDEREYIRRAIISTY